ncbi:MAG: hypothetical protein GC203_11480 [Phenylobacterium sp.]|nr:hypothetical protein [Phenylobacterium sp.]
MGIGAGGGGAGAGVGAGTGAAGAAAGVGCGAGAGVWALAMRPLFRPLKTMKPRTPAPATPAHRLHDDSPARTRGAAVAARANTGLTSFGGSLRVIAATRVPSCAP